MYCLEHVVKKGETLYSISRQYNAKLSDIIDANPMVNVYNLAAGEIICIPINSTQNQFTHFTTYLVKEEDTLGSVLEINSINLADLMKYNDPFDIYLLLGSTLQVPIIGEGEGGITL